MELKQHIQNYDEETMNIRKQRERIRNQVREVKRHYEFMKQQAIKEMNYGAASSRALAKKAKNVSI